MRRVQAASIHLRIELDPDAVRGRSFGRVPPAPPHLSQRDAGQDFKIPDVGTVHHTIIYFQNNGGPLQECMFGQKADAVQAMIDQHRFHDTQGMKKRYMNRNRNFADFPQAAPFFGILAHDGSDKSSVGSFRQ